MRPRRTFRAWIAVIALAGCAPHHITPAPLDRGATETRYRAQLQARARAVQAVECDLVMRARIPAGRTMPWVDGRLILAPPDRLRARMGSVLGTALDMAARGDTLEAFVPKDALALAFDRAGDSIGVAAPGRLAFRVLSGAWHAPESAWASARAAGERLEIGWRDQGDSIALAIGPRGVPAEVTWTNARGTRMIVRYAAWTWQRGVAWPSHVDIDSLPGGWSVQFRMNRVRFVRPMERERLTLHFPSDVQRLSRADLRTVIEDLGREE